MTIPWITTINTAPWNQAQPVYPRTLTISRSITVAGTNDQIGNVGYSGAEQGNSGSEGEVVLFTKIPGDVQVKAVGRTTKAGELPGDSVTKPVWMVFIPATAIAQYSIRDRDIVIDDEGYRYVVGANAWTLGGYQLSTIREEA